MGAMKSLAWDYAIYLQQQAREADDLDFDIDETFRQIVNSELEIPQEYVDMWVSNNSVFASEDVVFDAETNSWKQQKRDSTGRFSKGFSDKTNAQINEEYEEKIEEEKAFIDYANDEYIYNEMIAPYYQYTDLDDYTPMAADVFSEFLEASIKDEEFPERLTDPYFYQYLQKVAESVPLELLERLREILELQMNVGHQTGERDIEIIGGRGVFVADILLNIKTGQEMWAAESLVKTSCCCGATEDKPCRCMKEGPMNCSAQEPKCPCYQDLEKNAEDNGYTEAEINLMRYDLVEHELENADYNYLYEVMLYGTTGWANLPPEDVTQQFKNIFER